MISGYNTSTPYGIKSAMKIVTQELHVNGFIVGSLRHKYIDEFYSKFVPRVANGEIKYKEHIVRGLEQAPQGIVDIHLGNNFGKSVLIVVDE